MHPQDGRGVLTAQFDLGCGKPISLPQQADIVSRGLGVAACSSGDFGFWDQAVASSKLSAIA